MHGEKLLFFFVAHIINPGRVGEFNAAAKKSINRTIPDSFGTLMSCFVRQTMKGSTVTQAKVSMV